MPFCKAYNAQVHYEIQGDETAPVVILSHSLGVDGDMWLPQVSSFTQQFRVVRYDTRGHGQTTASPGPYSMDLLGRDVLALLDELRLERVHFCGLSMGGAIGMWLGVNAPERINWRFRTLRPSWVPPKAGKAESSPYRRAECRR